VEAVLTMAHDVFISHSHVDKPAADAACAALEARGIRCWIAPRDINPGQDWAASIMRAIEGTRILLLVFSRSAKESIQVRREVAQAANSGKQILTLRIEDVRPEAELKFYLDSPHWLDAITKPFEAHLKRLADACAILLARLDTGHDSASSDAARPQLAGGKQNVAWWRRQRQPLKVALVAAVVGVLAAVAGLTGHLLRPSAAHAPPPGPASAPSGTSFAAPAPALNPAGGSDPRAQIVQLTGSWSDQGFVNAVVDRDTRIVALYLQSGMKATTLDQGASAILFGFQGVSQNGDPVALATTFQTNGFKVDDELEDSYLMHKLSDLFPLRFHGPLAPKDYTGGYWGGKFVRSLLFWIVQRTLGTIPADQDIQVINYLISQGADCNVPLSFLKSISYMAGDSPYQKLLPMMQSCAK
jgi:TIR domain